MNDRHVLGLSGGRDSAALAIYMRNQYPQLDIEYYFSDTGKELPETYEFLVRLEGFLGKKINHLDSGRDFDYWLRNFRYYLPSPQARWCTRVLKIQPFQKWIEETLKNKIPVINYVAIRADEPNREGIRSENDLLEVRFPFREDGLDKQDIINILEESGVGMPDYYEWRSRSGCTFCFFQQKIEWVRLMERHPEAFQEAIEYEKRSKKYGKYPFTWTADEPLEELARPERVEQIKKEHEKRIARVRAKLQRVGNPLRENPNEDWEEIYQDAKGCAFCHK